MRNFLTLVLAAGALAGCNDPHQSPPAAGILPVNVPVVTRQDYAIDLAAPGGSLTGQETARLDGWFAGLDLGYGDAVYVDGPYSEGARGDVAARASRYGLMIEQGAPVTTGAILPGNVRVVVSRTRAGVPNCPNWSRKAQPNGSNLSMSNFGCAVNSNLAALIANPEDLVRGRAGTGTVDSQTSLKAIQLYRSKTPTGAGELQSISTKGSK